MRWFSGVVLASAFGVIGSCVTLGCDLGVHTKVAAELAEHSGNPALAFAEGFASHIALDHLTYGSTFFWNGRATQETKDLLPIALAVNAAELRQVYRKYKKTKNRQYLYGALGGLAPDLLEMVYRLKTNNDENDLFPWHDRQSTLIFDEPAGAPGVHRRSTKLNIALTIATYKLDF
jgi:hypothetical protein